MYIIVTTLHKWLSTMLLPAIILFNLLCSTNYMIGALSFRNENFMNNWGSAKFWYDNYFRDKYIHTATKTSRAY